MPWKVQGVMEQRVAFVIAVQQQDKSMAEVCREFGISRPTGYLWVRRYEEAHSLLGLVEHSRRPHRSPTQTDMETEALVIALRDHGGWGARKLAVLAAQEGKPVPAITAHRMLRRHGRVEAPAVVQPATGRFCHEEPNQLLQMDFKGAYPVYQGKVHPLSLLDDHSRYLLGLWPLADQRAQSVKDVLETLFRSHGVPQALLMDHGSPWWSTTGAHGLTWLSVWLLNQDIALRYAGIRHPQTQGKVERLHRTLDERTDQADQPTDSAAWQRWAEEFRQEYNEVRPHEALGMDTPAQHYRAVNLHPYQEHPRPWDYGSAPVSRLNSQGCLTYRGQRYFVCEALAEHWVRVDELDSLLAVTFRTTTIREIDLRTGTSKAVVLSHRVY
jgi:transposase InsO family protein